MEQISKYQGKREDGLDLGDEISRQIRMKMSYVGSG